MSNRSDHISRILAGNVVRFEVEHYHKDGHIFPLSVTVSLVDIGGQQFFLAFHQDITERKREEEKLAKESTLMKTAVENLPVIFYLIDREGQFLLSIGAGLKGLGLKPNQVVGLSVYEIYKDFPAIIDSVKRSLAGEPTFFESTVTGSSYDNYLTPISDIKGMSLGIAGVAMDITERKQAEEKLKSINERFELATKAAAISVWEHDFITDIISIDDNFINIYGISLANYQIEFNEFIKLVKPDDVDIVKINIEKAIKSDKNTDFEFRIVRPDGEIRYIKAYCKIAKDNKTNKPIKLIGVNIDISDSTKAEKELLAAKEKAEESEIKLRNKNEELNKRNTFIQTVLDKLPIGLALNKIDEGDVIYMNKKFEEIYGWTSAEITSIASFFEKVYPDEAYRNQIIERIMTDINAGDPEKMHWENILISSKDGSRKVVNAFNIPLIEQNTMVSTVMDITSMHQIQNDLVEAKEHAEESDRLKSAFLANMSHEIRTPMNGILGFAGLLKEPKLSGEEQQEYIGIIEKSGARMLNIINDIVSISKIESGTMETHKSETNINEQTEYVYNLLKLDAEKKKLTIIINNGLPDKESIIKTDNEKFISILSNLVKNAIKYTDQGSIEFGYILKNKSTPGELFDLEFYIKDTGFGIPKDRREAIFERFIQADIVDKMARQGAGLGLAISRAYVAMLGGEIWVESEEGKGSTFYFTIPYNVEPKQKIIIENDVPADTDTLVKNLKILIAEDDETSEIFISLIVKEFSNEVIEARTGVEAVEKCCSNPDLDLILMDIQMPDLNGYEATRQIRKFNKNVVIIAQTAFGLAGDREKVIEAGCNDYIAKPIKKAELVVLIKKYFEK